MRRPPANPKPAPMSIAPSRKARSRFPAWLLAVLLGLVTLALYWPATGHDFVNLDDPDFVTANVHVQGGLNWEAVKWAFQLYGGDYWHPLTWLSLMLDASLFGQAARGFHFTNVALHAANGILLFLLLRMMTGALWRSAVVAALFALHPLRVESVAWVTERKDVLSGCFGLLALIAYAAYAQGRSQKPGTSNTQHVSHFTPRPSTFYLLSLCFFACGLMSKPMLVTWPLVMLLLDYWPLKRMQIAECRMQNGEASDTQHGPRAHLQSPIANRKSQILLPLLVEKVPFLVLSGISCVLTYLTEMGPQQAAGFEESTALLRLENACVASARYLGKTFWPVNLAVPYVNPGHWSWLEVGGSVLVVAGVCLAALWLGQRWPCLLVGWCWFWGTLIPVIGLTKGWGAFMADRFTYVPSIGALILTVWGACELMRRWQHREMALSVAGGAAIVLCAVLTWQQIGYWKESETLFRHALEVTENNNVAHKNLGVALGRKGRTDEAIYQFQEALRLKPQDAGTHNNLGYALDRKGQTDEAIREFQEAIRLRPYHADTHYILGVAFSKRGRADEAIRQFQEVIRLKADHAEAHYDLGVALDGKGQTEEAIQQYRQALRFKPGHAYAHYNLGVALARRGELDEAISQFREALRLKPADADAHYNLGVALGQKGQVTEAIREFQETIRLEPGHVPAHNNLGTALYRQGRATEAIIQFQEAIRLKPDFADAKDNLARALARRNESKARTDVQPVTP
jgi:protein O-mannosyl-transferase